MRQYASGIAVAIRNYHSFRKSMQVGPPAGRPRGA
jgi:hypothetical protein